MIIADIPAQFFYKNAPIWALFLACFIILIINSCVKKEESSLPVFFTALGGVIFSLLSSMSLVYNVVFEEINQSNFIANFNSISVVFVNFSLIFLTFIIYGQKTVKTEKFHELNLSQELFFLLMSGIGANLAASADNLIILMAGIFVLFISIFATFFATNQSLKNDSESSNEQKPDNIFWLPIMSILLGFVFFVFGAVIYTKSQNSFSITQVIMSENEALSAISFIFCWLALIIFAGILPFSRWVHRITTQPDVVFSAKIQLMCRVLFYFLMLKFVFIFQELPIMQSFLAVTALLLLILSVLYVLAVDKLTAFVDFILSAQLGFGLLLGFGLFSNCEQTFINIIIFAAAYIAVSSGLFIFLLKNKDKATISDLSELHKNQLWFVMFFALLLFTFAGLPLSAMFSTQLNILFMLIGTQSYFIATISAICGILLIFACTKIVVQIFSPAKIRFTSDENSYTDKTWVLNFAAILVTFMLIIIGISSLLFIAF